MDTPDQKEFSIALLRHFEMMSANIENWRYVATNADYLPPAEVKHALEQMLETFAPVAMMAQMAAEAEALSNGIYEP